MSSLKPRNSQKSQNGFVPNLMSGVCVCVYVGQGRAGLIFATMEAAR